MRKTLFLMIAASSLLLGGCTDKSEKDAKPTFLFWCFRKEIVSSDYHIPDLATPAVASRIEQALKAVPGYEDNTYNLEERTMTIRYKSSTVRMMNFEEAIALAGFSVNDRPANPEARKKNIEQGLLNSE